jgi:hypothetical protein
LRLLLDEHLAPVIAEQLRGRGHDVVAVAAEASLRQLPDEALMAWATSAGRALVTQDLGDFPVIHRDLLSAGKTHAGLILVSRRFSRQSEGVGDLVRALEGLLVAHPNERALTSQLCWL